jgi:O-antigen/teichoic acid export membrane protein
VNSFFRKNVAIGLAELVCRLPLIFTVGLLARSVGTENFGNWALILVLQVFVVGFAGLGLSSALSRYVPSAPATEATAYLGYALGLCAVPLAVAGLIFFTLQAPIGHLLGVKADLLWLVPLAVVLAAGSVADGLFDAFFKARMVVGRQIAFITARTMVEIVAVVLVFVSPVLGSTSAPHHLAAYVAAVALGKLLLYPLLLTGMAKGEGGWLVRPSRRRELIRYGLPLVPTFLAMWLVAQSDRLVLSHFVSKHDLGIYAFAATLAGYIVFLGYAVYPLLLPGASRLHDDGNSAALKLLFNDAQSLFLLLWGGGMACLALWSGELIAWTGGPAFAGAAPILLVLAYAVGFEHLMGIYQYIFHLEKRTDLILWLNLGNAACIVVALATAGAYGGIAWAPWAVLAATVVFNLIRYGLALRHIHLPAQASLVLGLAAVAMLTALLAHFLAHSGIVLRLIVTMAILLPLTGLTLKRRADPVFGAM